MIPAPTTFTRARAFGPPRYAIRRAASWAFRHAQRDAHLVREGARKPEKGETPLSESEVAHAVRVGLIGGAA